MSTYDPSMPFQFHDMLTFGTNEVLPYIHTCHITCKSPPTAMQVHQIPLSCTCIALKSALRYPHILPQQSYLLDRLLYPLGSRSCHPRSSTSTRCPTPPSIRILVGHILTLVHRLLSSTQLTKVVDHPNSHRSEERRVGKECRS